MLAEFIGAKDEGDGRYDMYGIIPTIHIDANEPDKNHLYRPEDMLFDISFDWSLTVVKKIERDPFEGMVIVEIFDERCNIETPDWTEYKNFVVAETKEQAIFDAIVDFVKYYNKTDGKRTN